ncbi:MAG: UDP-glucose 4-epimerase GalE [Clostridiales bacterium]|nr:UDP-glucose 4-epimerase GalE [Clostridiales bacterium]
MKLLVTGGLGFIGSHTVVELVEAGHEVVILDNLSNSRIEVLDNLEKIIGFKPKFYKADLMNIAEVRAIFEENEFDGVIHFAGLKAVGESVEKPLEYYENNIGGSINLLYCMRDHGVKKIVFSSSACVYGVPEQNPITEDSPSNQVTNPYGRTKFFIEEILKDCAIADPTMKITILRYFNPVGAHHTGLIGEDPNGIPNNLMPFIQRVADGRSDKLKIFGNDYPTPDGTCIRDFIHVVDLAKGHVKAIEKIEDKTLRIVNLGTGKGTSVLELVDTFNKVNGDLVKYEFAPKRAGDVPANFANPERAKTELDWEAHLTIEDMCRDAWNFTKNTDKK